LNFKDKAALATNRTAINGPALSLLSPLPAAMAPLSLLALSLALASSPVHAASAGSFASAGSTLVSAMMVSPGSTFLVHIVLT